jgi:ferredoxin
MLKEGSDVVDPELGAVSSVTLVTGFTDSSTMRILSYSGEDSLSRDSFPDSFIDTWNSRVKKVNITWSSVENAAGYEVRVSHKPITENNWPNALFVNYTVVNKSSGSVNASIALGKSKITPGKCVNCGECVKACPFGAISTIDGKAVVDPSLCTSCGECYESCKYDALNGFFSGHPYYFAVRAINDDGAVSPYLYCTPAPYALRYITVADIPDDQKPANVGKPIPVIGGCGGNCDVIINSDGECENGSCYIVRPRQNYYISDKKDPNIHKSVCPTGAIYSKKDTSLTDSSGAIFINQDDCIACGKCATQCAYDNGHGAVTTEVYEATPNDYGRD